MSGTHDSGGRRWRERAAEILVQIIVLLVICSVVALFEIVLRGN